MALGFHTVPSLEGKLAAGYAEVGAVGTSVLLAVSGGADSMALLDASCRLAAALGLTLEVASVDHGLRRASAGEVARVGRAAARRKLPFHPLAVQVGPGAGLEARARALRYQALESLRQARGLALVATAHTATDQAETVLMRLGRGAGLGGAAGILPRRGTIIRPLLACTRAEVDAWVRARRLRVAQDPMNRDPAFTRARVRKTLLPALRAALGPAAEEALARFAAFAAEDHALLEEWTEAAGRRLSGEAPDQGLDAVGLGALPGPLRRRLFARMLGARGLAVDAAVLERMESALRSGGGCALPEGAQLRTAGGWVRVEGPAAPGVQPPLRGWWLRRDGPALEVGGYLLAWRSAPPGGAHRWVQPLLAPVPGDLLEVRFRQPGDRVRLASGKRRKLQDLLVDARVPREARDRLPLLVEPGGSVLCAAGTWPHRGEARGGWVAVDHPTGRRAGEREGCGL